MENNEKRWALFLLAQCTTTLSPELVHVACRDLHGRIGKNQLAVYHFGEMCKKSAEWSLSYLRRVASPPLEFRQVDRNITKKNSAGAPPPPCSLLPYPILSIPRKLVAALTGAKEHPNTKPGRTQTATNYPGVTKTTSIGLGSKRRCPLVKEGSETPEANIPTVGLGWHGPRTPKATRKVAGRRVGRLHRGDA